MLELAQLVVLVLLQQQELLLERLELLLLELLEQLLHIRRRHRLRKYHSCCRQELLRSRHSLELLHNHHSLVLLHNHHKTELLRSCCSLVLGLGRSMLGPLRSRLALACSTLP